MRHFVVYVPAGGIATPNYLSRTLLLPLKFSVSIWETAAIIFHPLCPSFGHFGTVMTMVFTYLATYLNPLCCPCRIVLSINVRFEECGVLGIPSLLIFRVRGHKHVEIKVAEEER